MDWRWIEVDWGGFSVKRVVRAPPPPRESQLARWIFPQPMQLFIILKGETREGRDAPGRRVRSGALTATVWRRDGTARPASRILRRRPPGGSRGWVVARASSALPGCHAGFLGASAGLSRGLLRGAGFFGVAAGLSRGLLRGSSRVSPPNQSWFRAGLNQTSPKPSFDLAGRSSWVGTG